MKDQGLSGKNIFIHRDCLWSCVSHIYLYVCVNVNFTKLKEKNVFLFKILIFHFKNLTAPPGRAIYLIWHILQVRYCIKKSIFCKIYLTLLKLILVKLSAQRAKTLFNIFLLNGNHETWRMEIKFLNGDINAPKGG